MSVSVAVLDDYQRVAEGLAPWSSLGSGAVVTFFHEPARDHRELVARLRPFEVLVLMRERTRLDAALIEQLPNLRLIVSPGKTNAAIDYEAAKRAGVDIVGTETIPHATPELTWALILAFARNLVPQVNEVRAGGWQVGLGMELSGKTLGILGLGKVGARVARYGQAFGMRVLAWSENLTRETAAGYDVEWVERDELFRRADVLSIHMVLSARSRGLVADRELRLMKPSAFIVNTSRGPIVSERALIAALQEHRIAGAALDVFDQEPLPPEHPFRRLDNVLATPHIGYVGQANYRHIYGQCVESLRAWLCRRAG
ncbi:D-2-hydroxyacid dehydrogenase family protein [Peristeroidobacter soli]|jgi:phosphoglycerate dehydrogenase-like enzyme|uniref:D-2-hydroxyacid dehydrogenase family protein n=1 Tax=Peristeroidobacter soli TaxID=2497877 RepID=UPI00101DF459|nr:D-2-hydroxyacid dehydrogenase family protein [Peristeroidobacter soli]